MKIPSSLKNFINKCRNKPLMCILVVVLIVTIVLVALKMTDNLPKPSPNTFANIEGFSSGKIEDVSSEDQLKPEPDQIILALFYTNWCGHCKNFKPDFEGLDLNEVNKDRTGQILLKRVDCEEHADLCKKYEIAGYPTLRLFKPNSDSTEFDTGEEFSRKDFNVETLKNLTL